MYMCFATAIAETLNCKVFVNGDKKRIIDCIESEEILQIIESNDPVLSPLHVLPMNKLNTEVSSNVIVLLSCVFMSHVIIPCHIINLMCCRNKQQLLSQSLRMYIP